MAVFAFFDSHNGAFNAVFSGFVAIFTLLLFMVGRDQHDRLKESIEHAKESSQRELRAYMFVEVLKVEHNPKTDLFEVTLKATNTGKTPAREVEFVADITPGALPNPGTLVMPDLPPGSRCDLGGGMPLELVVSHEKLSPEDLAALRTKERTHYIWGWLTYEDAFQQPRETRFRFYLRDDDGVVRIATHAEGNHAT